MRITRLASHNLDEDLDAALDALDRAQPVIREPRVERRSLHELHREVGRAVLVDRKLVDRHDVRVLELTRDLPPPR